MVLIVGYGLFIKNVYLNRGIVSELPDLVENTRENIQSAKEHILTLMSASPRDFKDEFNNDFTWENYVQCELNNVWQELQSDIVSNYLAKIALESPGDVIEG